MTSAERDGAADSTRTRNTRLMAQLIDSVTDFAIFALDPSGIITTWNPGARRLHGYDAGEIIGKHFSTFYTREDLESGKPERELAIAVAEGRYEEEGWRVRQDGTRFWANVVITAIRGKNDRLVGFGEVTRDLTERKRGEDAMRASEEKFRTLVTSVADYAIFLLNEDGTVASWNIGAQRLKGYRADEILGRHLSTFYTEEDRNAEVPNHALESARTAGRWENEGWRVRKDGTRFWANVVITALRDAHGEHWGYAKVTRDLTQRKRNDDALRGVLARERDAAAQLRQADELRTELVAMIAHDLRGPVGVLQNLVHLLEADWPGLDDDARRELFERINNRLGIMGALADDVFDVSRIEAGELHVDLAVVDLEQAVTRVVLDTRISFPDRKIEVIGTGPVAVRADERRLWEVLSNLLSNALKFSTEDTVVNVAIATHGRDAVVSIADQGPGIPHDLQVQLFQRFVRLPQSAGAPGSGLGLYIVKSLTEAMGGRVWVDSTTGIGSIFHVAFPTAT